jgi:hypothetical protein
MREYANMDEIIDALDGIQPGDPERARAEADAILVAAMPEPVRDAYERARDLCRWGLDVEARHDREDFREALAAAENTPWEPAVDIEDYLTRDRP